MDLTARDWLAIIREEYLHDFIGAGGAAVKFAVTSEPAARDDLRDAVLRIAAEDGFAGVAIDAARTKIHMIDHLFHAIARQVDWSALAYQFVSRTLITSGYHVPPDRSDFHLAEVAALNDRQEIFLRNELKRLLERAITGDYRMSQEFRFAMIQLCQAELDPGGVSSFLTTALAEWLRGELRLISSVKEALIFQKVARHNARHMLLSLTHWLRLNGWRGMVLTLDIARYAEPSRGKEAGQGHFYSTPAAMDAYEVLRQCIDGTDELEACLIVVLTGQGFVDDERRGLDRYDALRLRISDEVRDRGRQNPLASLVRLSSDAMLLEPVSAMETTA